MNIVLHPDMVAAGIAFLDDEKLRRLEKALASIDADRQNEGFVERVCAFLITEVGLEKLHEQWESYKTGLPLRDLSPVEKKGLQEGDILLFFFCRPFDEDPEAVATRWLPIFAEPSPFLEAVGIRCLPIFAEPSPFLNVSKILRKLGVSVDPQAVANDAYLLAEVEAAYKDYREALSVAIEEAQKRRDAALYRRRH